MPPESPYFPLPKWYSSGEDKLLEEYYDSYEKAITRKIDKEMLGVPDCNSSSNQCAFRKIIETTSKTNMWVDTWVNLDQVSIYEIMVDEEMQSSWWDGLEPPPEGAYHITLSPLGTVKYVEPRKHPLIDYYGSDTGTIFFRLLGYPEWGPNNVMLLPTTAGNIRIEPPVVYTGTLDKGSWVEVSSEQSTMTTTITDLTRK